MKELVSVLVPILNTLLTPFETQLLDHCNTALSKYSLILVVSEGADVSSLTERYQRADIISFNEKYFRSRQTLSTLLLMEGFYERFSWSDFLLIHELNSWIVKDELHYWCKQGYDYLKADPIISGLVLNEFSKIRGLTEAQKTLVDMAFNGNGLYLCNIERMIKTLQSSRKIAHAYRHQTAFINGDSLFWELDANRFWPKLRKPTKIVQTRFSRKLDEKMSFTNKDREAWPFGLTDINKHNIKDLPYFG
jgi:hypothetical protein